MPPRTIAVISLTYAMSNRPAPPAYGLSDEKTPTHIVTELDRLYNTVPQFGKAERALVGSDRTILVHFRSGRVWVSVNTKLPGGTIYVRSDLKNGVADITGGTGRYTHAHGILVIRDLNVPALASNVYRFTP